ncbi:GntR family transcriptional regulator [Zhenpiania hominis]|uniref:GntR family transcriptional regulator n=1 Tax=Zhenpiania hominis TaxID=2763644 RepID=A0A923SQA5_9FIRM|nr:GntR family transcriptional regulator [Zhenpiania hominis]MBC6679422.1 GntR family transcriptional regulator [Zhenpiania hominis]
MAQAKYLQVKEDILKKIQIGKLCPMDMLPSENALCQEYSMSRMSIRKALNILLSEGYISSVPGKGYFVNRPTIDQYILRCDSNQFTEVTIDQIRLKTSTIVRPDDDIRLRLKLHEKEKAIVLEHLYYANQKIAAWSQKYLPYRKGSPLIEEVIGYATHPDKAYEKRYPFALEKSIELSTMLTDETLMQIFQLSAPDSVLVISQSFHDREQVPILWGKMFILSEYSKLTAESLL